MPQERFAGAAFRQTLTATTFVEIVDTLVGDFDVIEVLTSLTSRCVELLNIGAACILLADDDGQLRVIGASTEESQLKELFQVQSSEGPCLDCFRTGRIKLLANLASLRDGHSLRLSAPVPGQLGV